MSILIIGAQGRIGSSLVSFFISKGHEVIPWTRADIRLEKEEACLHALQRIPESVSTLINCAAIGSIEACEDDPLNAHLVNTRAPELMAQYTRSKGIRFIHISTDYVLEGERKGLKNEHTKCHPINVYGESKLESESRVLDTYPQSIIARVAWVFGNKEKPSFPDMIYQRILKNEPLSAIHDKWSLPTSITTICRAMELLVQDINLNGIIHICNSGQPITWHDYAQNILHFCQEKGIADRSMSITPTSIKQSQVQTIDRPLHSALDNGLLQSHLSEDIPTWQDDLRCYLNSLEPYPHI